MHEPQSESPVPFLRCAAQPPVNRMIGPFLDTLKPGEIYDNGGLLFGGCSQHGTLKTGIHVTIKCAVPTGQDAPCFKDANGNPYPQASQRSSGSSVSGRHASQKNSIPNGVEIYWVCHDESDVISQDPFRRKDTYYYSAVFEGTITRSDAELFDAGKYEEDPYQNLFNAWLDSRYADIFPQRRAEGKKNQGDWSSHCHGYKAIDEANEELQSARDNSAKTQSQAWSSEVIETHWKPNR